MSKLSTFAFTAALALASLFLVSCGEHTFDDFLEDIFGSSSSAEEEEYGDSSSSGNGSSSAGGGASESYDIAIEPLLKSEWNQSLEYTFLFPVDRTLDNGICEVIAYGQILFYHGLVPSGKVSYTDNQWQVALSADFDNPRVDISKVVPKIDRSTPEENKIETSRYLWYTAMASRSPGRNVAEKFSVLKSNHGNGIGSSTHTKDDMEDYIISELSENRPLFLRISGTTGLAREGHAVVIDGIRKNANQTLVHLNFGWGGGANGWYDLWQPIRAGGYYFDNQGRGIEALRPKGTPHNSYENKLLEKIYGTYRSRRIGAYSGKEYEAIMEITSDSITYTSEDYIGENVRWTIKVDSYVYDTGNTSLVTRATHPNGFRGVGTIVNAFGTMITNPGDASDLPFYFSPDFNSIARGDDIYYRQ